MIGLRSRGQALLETALALPVFLVATFGVLWALNAGVIGERVQLAARYGGLVSAEGNPYEQYSFYALYQGAAGTPLALPCATPPPLLVENQTPVQSPAQPAQSFWQPNTTPTTSASCGRVTTSAAGLSMPVILGHAQFTVNADSPVPPPLQGVMGAVTAWNAEVNQLESPDIGALIQCSPEVSQAIAAALTPTEPSAPGPIPTPIANPQTTAIGVSANCTG